MATTSYGISPESRASLYQFFRRQFLVTPLPVTTSDADLHGQTAIITGGNGGIGLETARQLLALGCEVILAVRDEEKGHRARQILMDKGHFPSSSIRVWPLDLARTDSITAFAERCKKLERLDIAILNAGLYKIFESFSTTGYEEGVQINYLSNALLLLLLLPIMKIKTAELGTPGRICLVSSDVAAWCKFDERNADPILPTFKRPMRPHFDNAERYGTTKLMGQMLVSELAKRIPSSTVTLSCANPGLCGGTELGRESTGLFRFVSQLALIAVSRAPSIGARTIVHAVTTLGEHAHGEYVEDGKIQPMAPLVDTSEGAAAANSLYGETLNELSFAGVHEIVEAVAHDGKIKVQGATI
ncbi:hypothetical protein F5Y12DRAFT_794631 [Xylaria sp. FL1777]|nr:hypothetical protein F5Y12DRAFT_794631 [Xylaria sp. FL1777]